MDALLREAKEKNTEISSHLREQIVLEHTPLIRYIVNRIAVRLPSHIDLDDLHNTGVIGLMDAIEKYDPEKNCKFKTYAEFRIKGAILDQLRSLDWVPRSVRQKGRRLERARERLRLSRQDLADAVKVHQTTVWRWETEGQPMLSTELASVSRVLGVSSDHLLFGTRSAAA